MGPGSFSERYYAQSAPLPDSNFSLIGERGDLTSCPRRGHRRPYVLHAERRLYDDRPSCLLIQLLL